MEATKMRNVVIVDGVRTGFGKLGGSLRQFGMSDLAAKAIDGLLEKTQLLERGGKVEGVYMGSALHDHATHAPARMSVLKSRLGYDVWTSFVERQCAIATRVLRVCSHNVCVQGRPILLLKSLW